MFIPPTHRILFIDDDPTRHEIFTHCMEGKFPKIVHTWGFHDTIDVLEQQAFDTIFFDHDLGDHREPDIEVGAYRNRELTGADIAAWVARTPQAVPQQCVVHSANPVGALAIRDIMREVCAVEVMQFGELYTVIG